jgi:hypothetical protein
MMMNNLLKWKTKGPVQLLNLAIILPWKQKLHSALTFLILSHEKLFKLLQMQGFQKSFESYSCQLVEEKKCC